MEIELLCHARTGDGAGISKCLFKCVYELLCMYGTKEICKRYTARFCNIEYMIMPAAKVFITQGTLFNGHAFTLNRAAAAVCFVLVTLKNLYGNFFL